MSRNGQVITERHAVATLGDGEAEADTPEEADTPGIEADSDTSPDPARTDGQRSRLHWRLRTLSWSRILALGLLPLLAVALAVTAGVLKWQNVSAREAETAANEATSVASDSTVAMLSYTPDNAEQSLTAATDRMTGQFKDDYRKLITDVVVPGARDEHISASARITAVGPVSATRIHAVVLVFVNQTIVMGGDAPSDSASAVRVTLDKEGDRWLVSGFEPV